MRPHEENKILALLELNYTEEQAEEILSVIIDRKQDETDLFRFINQIKNWED